MTELEAFKKMLARAELNYTTSTDLYVPTFETVTIENVSVSGQEQTSVDVLFYFDKPTGELKNFGVRKEKSRRPV